MVYGYNIHHDRVEEGESNTYNRRSRGCKLLYEIYLHQKKTMKHLLRSEQQFNRWASSALDQVTVTGYLFSLHISYIVQGCWTYTIVYIDSPITLEETRGQARTENDYSLEKRRKCLLFSMINPNSLQSPQLSSCRLSLILDQLFIFFSLAVLQQLQGLQSGLIAHKF